jgi:hypothetical protein
MGYTEIYLISCDLALQQAKDARKSARNFEPILHPSVCFFSKSYYCHYFMKDEFVIAEKHG